MPVTSPSAQTFSEARIRWSTSIPRPLIVRPSGSSPSHVRLPPGRDQQPVERELAAVAQPEAAGCGARRLHLEAHIDAVFLERVGDERRSIRVDALQDAAGALRRPSRASRRAGRTAPARSRPARPRARPGVRGPRSSRWRPRSSSSRRSRARRPVGSPRTSRSRSRAGRIPAHGRRRAPARARSRSPRRGRARRPAPSSHSTCELSSRSATTSRHANTFCGSSVLPAIEPSVRRGRREELRCTQHRLRRHTGPVRALAADEPPLDQR